MNKRFYIFIVFFCISINIFAQEHKNALLIANEIYETSEKEQKLKYAQNQNLDENLLLFPDLKTPIKEAHDLRDTLQELGFTVTLLENADKKQIRKALRDFQGKTKSEKGIAFFHYGGHAVQINGENYLIPAKNDVVSNSDISDEAVKVESIIDSMHGENNVVVLDACRVIPYRSTGTRGGSGSVRGLASIALNKPNFIVIHSASSGESAVDGVFTPIFTKHIKEKKSLTTILMEVRTDVHRVARNQNPEDRSQLTQDIYLAGYENNVLAISGTTGKLEISVISPCSIFLSENKITELNAFETKVIDVPTGSLNIKAKYSDGHETAYQCIVKTNGKEVIDFQYTMKSEADKCYELGENYYYGRNGSKKDFNKAFDYYSIAAKSEHSDAQNMLGICYENGNGHSKNEKEALAWYKKAANNGNRWAMGNAGLCYEYGKGTSVNYKEAKRWYEKAVSNGYSDAQKYLNNINNKINEENRKLAETKNTNAKEEQKYKWVKVDEYWGDGKLFYFWLGGFIPTITVGAPLMICGLAIDNCEGLLITGGILTGIGVMDMIIALCIDNEYRYEKRLISDKGDFFQNFKVAIAPNAVSFNYRIAL